MLARSFCHATLLLVVQTLLPTVSPSMHCPCAHPTLLTLLTLLTPSTRPSTGASHLHTTMLDKIIAFITANPILFVAIAFRALLASNLATHRTTADRARAAVAVIYKQWQAKQPWPDFGGRITSLKTAEAWQQCQRVQRLPALQPLSVPRLCATTRARQACLAEPARGGTGASPA